MMRRAKHRRNPDILGAVIGVLLLIAIIGAITGWIDSSKAAEGTSSGSGLTPFKIPGPMLPGVVGYGDLSASWPGSGNHEAFPHPQLVVTGVATCGWLDGHIIVRVKFTNHLSGRLAPSVYWYPRYLIHNSTPVIGDDSPYGDRGEPRHTQLRIAKTTEIAASVGAPGGIHSDLSVSVCNPRIMEVDPS